MDLLKVVREINPYFVDGPELTPTELENLSALSSPAVLLLGQVQTILRTWMFDEPTTAWVDGWPRSHRAARMEWINGPEVPVVAAHLAAKEGDGWMSGVPGLRLTRCDACTATLTWYGHDEPVILYLTRLTDSSELPPHQSQLAVVG
ncbi:hypothetical protein [Kribbella sp. NPDC051620]|uniref:hypothetical protein n=1 Tax=Kribbella sp. NPDC051620 TaxID=3364120 RepID=UPI0037972DB3